MFVQDDFFCIQNIKFQLDICFGKIQQKFLLLFQQIKIAFELNIFDNILIFIYVILAFRKRNSYEAKLKKFQSVII